MILLLFLTFFSGGVYGENSTSVNETALWDTVKDSIPEMLAGRVAEDLATQLELPMNTTLGPESKFFKHHYRSNWHNKGVMVREMDVIRQQEGW